MLSNEAVEHAVVVVAEGDGDTFAEGAFGQALDSALILFEGVEIDFTERVEVDLGGKWRGHTFIVLHRALPKKGGLPARGPNVVPPPRVAVQRRGSW